MKRFLTITSQLPETMLTEHVYEPADNHLLEFGQTHFPLIPLINAYAEESEKISICTVTYDTANCHRNLELLKAEIEKLCAPKNISFEVDSIEVPFDDSIQAILNVYLQLISRVEDGDELFADITYGSKPMPIVLTMALQYAYRTKRDVAIECVVYGQISHHKDSMDARLYDVTALVQLDEIVRLIADRNVSDPAAVIEQITAV